MNLRDSIINYCLTMVDSLPFCIQSIDDELCVSLMITCAQLLLRPINASLVHFGVVHYVCMTLRLVIGV